MPDAGALTEDEREAMERAIGQPPTHRSQFARVEYEHKEAIFIAGLRHPMPDTGAHRVEIEFDDGIFAKLVCPESGCQPAQNCSECGRDLRQDVAEQLAEKIQPCHDCKDADTWKDECWIKTWFDNLDATELLVGKVTVEIDAEWDGDHAIAHIRP